MRISRSEAIQLAFAKLDWFERHPEHRMEFRWAVLEEASGRKRQTLWRDDPLYARYKQVKKFLSNEASIPLSGIDIGG
jgi:hypothetical protein